jgi:hypothetical protein
MQRIVEGLERLDNEAVGASLADLPNRMGAQRYIINTAAKSRAAVLAQMWRTWSTPPADLEHRRQNESGGEGGLGGEAPLPESISATPPQDRRSGFGGGVVVAAEAPRDPRLEWEITDLEGASRRRGQTAPFVSISCFGHWQFNRPQKPGKMRIR